MTTTITVKTHSWPVDITTTDRFGRSIRTDVETVPPHSERTVHITDSRQVMFTELPLPSGDFRSDVDDFLENVPPVAPRA